MELEALIRQINPFEIDSDRTDTIEYLQKVGVPNSYVEFLVTTNGGFLQNIGYWEAKVNGIDVFLRGFLGVLPILRDYDIFSVSQRMAIASEHSKIRYLVISFDDVFSNLAFDLEKLRKSPNGNDSGLVIVRDIHERITKVDDLDCGFMSLVDRIQMIPESGWDDEPLDFKAVRLSQVNEITKLVRSPNCEHSGCNLRLHALRYANEEAIDILIDKCSFTFEEADLVSAIESDNLRAARALVRRGIKLPSLDYLIARAHANNVGEMQLIGAMSLYPKIEIQSSLRALEVLSNKKGFWSSMDRRLERELDKKSSVVSREE